VQRVLVAHQQEVADGAGEGMVIQGLDVIHGLLLKISVRSVAS
jgi:hypothetical protein